VKEIVNNSEKFKKYAEDKRISRALMASFVILTIQYFTLIYFNLLKSGVGSRVQLISKVLVGLAFLYAIPLVLKRSKIKAIGIYAFSTFVFLLNYAIFPENRAYLVNLIVPFYMMCMPALIYTLSIRNFVVFKEVMKESSYIVFLFGALLGILIFTGRASTGTYSMALSYYMLLPTIIFIDELIDKFSLRIASFIGISLLIIIALGSRGAVLCVVVFVFLKIIKVIGKLTFKRVLAYIGLLSIGVISFINLDRIFEKVYLILLNYGIKSRSLLLFSRDEVHLSGRESIYNSLIIELSNSPFLGIGIAGDRLIHSGSYAHNIFLEILVNFGLIIGIIIVTVLVIIIIKNLLIKDKEKYAFFIIWLNLGFVHLMVSSTYITDMKFWIFLGITLNLLKKNTNVSFNNDVN